MKKFLLIIAFAIFGLGLNAQNVGDETTIEYDGYSLEFSVTSVEPAECELSDCSGSPTDVVVPSSVEILGTEYNITSIGGEAFYVCSSLTSIEIPSSVTSIGDDAFSWCDSLISVTFGENSQLTSIEDYAFFGCSSLTSIEIPSSVNLIGNRVFHLCPSLTSMVVEEENTIYDSRDNCNAIIKTSKNTLIFGCQNTIIPNTVTSIGDEAFENCTSLTSIEIPSSVTSIKRFAFNMCENLMNVTFGEDSQLRSIGDYAFSDCGSLTSIKIPNSVISIEYEVFFNCKSLTNIEIPNSVTYIEEHAFYECSGLKAIKCYAENIPETGADVFYDCPLDMIIYVPEVSLENYKATSPWNNFTIYSLEGTQNVIATPTSISSISLSWDTAEDADSYNIYRDGNSIANVVDTLYLDENLNCLTRYCYKITAVRNETETDKSEEVCATTFDLPITTPENLVAEATSDSSILLTWNEVENALSYNIYRDGDSIANVTTSTYTDNDLEYDTKYCYEITAVRNETETEESGVVCATTFDLPITTPENLVATPTSTSSIELTWNEVENALSYNIYCDGDSIANVTTATYTDNDLEYDTEYCYTVTAVRNETETEKSEEVCATTFDLPITTPENLVATPTSTSSIELTWNEVENALSYNIYRDGDSIANVTETSYSDENLDSDSTYCYEVAAVRNETETEKSEEVCATTLKSDDGNDDGNDDGTESIEELSSSFKIYPNPVQNELFLATELRVEEVSIYDIYGRQQAVSYQPSAVSSIDVADLEAGVYFINIKTENGNVVKRFIKT